MRQGEVVSIHIAAAACAPRLCRAVRSGWGTLFYQTTAN